MFSLSNLKTLHSLLRFLLALRSFVRSLTFLTAFFHLRSSLFRAETLCSLSYSHLLLPVFAYPWAQSTSGSALSLLSALLLLLSLFFGGGELWRYWPSGLWSRMSRHTSGGSIMLTPVCTFSFLRSPFLSPVLIMLLVSIALASWSFGSVDSVCSVLLVVLVRDLK